MFMSGVKGCKLHETHLATHTCYFKLLWLSVSRFPCMHGSVAKLFCFINKCHLLWVNNIIMQLLPNIFSYICCYFLSLLTKLHMIFTHLRVLKQFPKHGNYSTLNIICNATEQIILEFVEKISHQCPFQNFLGETFFFY